MNPYRKYVSDFAELVRAGKSLPLGEIPRLSATPKTTKGNALFFAPHPDDECIVGALAVRIARESGLRLKNVAVTLGSKKNRQAERLVELEAACKYLDFDLLTTGPGGLEQINPRTRSRDPSAWAQSIRVVQGILVEHEPRVILFPHEHDWNSTHIGSHFLVMDALKEMPEDFECFLVETEFWGQMAEPNLMVEISEDDLADMIAATSFHVGEVKRNPYHLLLPAWTMDNVRRGTELVGGQGGVAPDYMFAALYRLRKWSKGQATSFLESGRPISKSENVGNLFI